MSGEQIPGSSSKISCNYIEIGLLKELLHDMNRREYVFSILIVICLFI